MSSRTASIDFISPGTAVVMSELSFLVAYTCPRCLAELEARLEQTSTWLRCPKCGRACLPPDQPPPVVRPRPSSLEEIVFLNVEDGTKFAPLAPLRIPKRSFSVWRIIMGTGMLVSFLVLSYALYDQNTLMAAIFGFIVIVFLGLLTYPTKPRRD